MRQGKIVETPLRLAQYNSTTLKKIIQLIISNKNSTLLPSWRRIYYSNELNSFIFTMAKLQHRRSISTELNDDINKINNSPDIKGRVNFKRTESQVYHLLIFLFSSTFFTACWLSGGQIAYCWRSGLGVWGLLSQSPQELAQF